MTVFRTSLRAATFGACMALFAAQASAQSTTASTERSTPTQAGAILTPDQIEARFEAAKERCEPLKGDAQDVCEKEAETDHIKAKADAELHEKASEAQKEAARDKARAEYELGEARCDALSGSEEKACKADLDARFKR